MLSHLPTNHHLRPIYRLLALVSGVYVLVFGVVGLVQTSGAETFDRSSGATALGLPTNPAFAYASIGTGVLIVLAALVGRNIDFYVYLVVGLVFQLAGMLTLAFLGSDVNFFNFSVATCVVSLVVGLALFTAGLYSRVGAQAEAH